MFYLNEERPHTCNAVLPTIRRSWVRERIREIITRKALSPSELSVVLKDKFEVDVDNVMVSNALNNLKQEARESVPFGILSPFLHALSSLNNATTALVTSRDGLFERAFLAPGMCVATFHHTTWVVGLDACDVKASYGGVLLVKTLLDRNGNVFIAALGIAESENSSSWEWFLTQVKTAFNIEEVTVWSFSVKGEKESMLVSDMFSQERIIHYVSTTSKKNLRKHHHTSLNGLVFKAAKAATPREFDETINEMKALHKAGGNYIEGIGKERWARAFSLLAVLGTLHLTFQSQ